MQVGSCPAVRRAARSSSGDTDVEAGFDASDLRQNGFVECLLRDCAFAPSFLPSGNYLMLVVQAKSHCPKHDVKALSKDVIVRAEFRDVLHCDAEPCPADTRIILETENITLELCGGFFGVWELIEIKAQFGGCRAGWAMHEAERVLDELIVEAEKPAFDLVLS